MPGERPGTVTPLTAPPAEHWRHIHDESDRAPRSPLRDCEQGSIMQRQGFYGVPDDGIRLMESASRSWRPLNNHPTLQAKF